MVVVLMLPLLVALALPPVTQEEALAFHIKVRCMGGEIGRGITRPDGKGWIVSSLPGKHVILTGTQSVVLDITPGKAYRITASGPVEWCPEFVPPGRAACGPVPAAFLYDAKLASDPNPAVSRSLAQP
jgi:hypothetical protein